MTRQEHPTNNSNKVLTHPSLVVIYMLILLIGAVPLYGWLSHHTILTDLLPDIHRTTFNTALSFVLMAIALMLNATHRAGLVILGKIFIAIVVLFAALALIQITTGAVISIDGLLKLQHLPPADTPYLDRMSPLTAFSFIVFGISLLIFTEEHAIPRITANLTALLCLFILLISIADLFIKAVLPDIPSTLIHFSSISLYTSMGMVLLFFATWKFIGKTEYQKNPLTLWSPGIDLMRQLRYTPKFILIGCLFLIPVSYMMTQLIRHISIEITLSNTKQLGLEYVQQINPLIIQLPQHRGLSYFTADNNRTVQSLERKRLDIEQTMTDINETLGRELRVNKQWGTLHNNWNQLIKDAPQLARSTNWEHHSQLVQSLLGLLKQVSINSGLYLDDHTNSRHLIETTLEHIPLMIEYVAQLRDQGSNALSDQYLTDQEYIEMAEFATAARFELNQINGHFNTVFANSPALKKQLADHLINLTNNANHYLLIADNIIATDNKPPYRLQRYFVQGTAMTKSAYTLLNTSIQILDTRFKEIVAEQRGQLYMTVILAVFCIIIAIYLIMAFYKSIIRTADELRSLTVKLKRSEIVNDGISHSNDEIGDIVISFNDIAHELISARMKMETIINNTQDVIVIIDENGLITMINRAVAKIFEYTPDELIGMPITLLMPHQYRERHTQGLAHYKTDGATGALRNHVILEGLRKHGEVFPLELIVSEIMVDNKRQFLGLLRDVTNRKLNEDKLRRLASTDPLTGVYNRRYFFERLENEMKRAYRYGQPMSLLMMDIDHFKTFNDTYGHHVGDQILKAICDSCTGVIREIDAIGRFGGEEFVILFPDTNIDAAIVGAERLRASVEKTTIKLGDETLNVSISIGVTQLVGNENSDIILKRADKAMYDSKNNGRNQVSAL